MEEDNYSQPFLSNDQKEFENDEIEMERAIEETIRKGLIVKVYGIVLYQLSIIGLMIYLGFAVQSFRNFLLNSFWLLILFSIVALVCLFLPLCSPNIYRNVPTNYIVLTIFSISFGYLIASETCQFAESSVLTALFFTIITVVSLTLYAWKTKSDFSFCGGVLFVSLILVIFASIFLLFFNSTFLYMLILVGSLIIFCIYLIYDTQLLIGGKMHKYSEDDYILAAIQIYLDIVNIFIYLLRLFGNK